MTTAASHADTTVADPVLDRPAASGEGSSPPSLL
jgi:hypothetical protein